MKLLRYLRHDGDVRELLPHGLGVRRRSKTVFLFRNFLCNLKCVLPYQPERACEFLTAVAIGDHRAHLDLRFFTCAGSPFVLLPERQPLFDARQSCLVTLASLALSSRTDRKIPTLACDQSAKSGRPIFEL